MHAPIDTYCVEANGSLLACVVADTSVLSETVNRDATVRGKGVTRQGR